MGITPEAAYTTDLLAVRNGNAGSGDGWDYAGRVDAGLDFDFEKLAGIPGLSLYASAAWSSGQDLSERQVGNLFAVQQIFTGRKVRLAQLYLQQQVLDDPSAFKVGRLTTEDDFSRIGHLRQLRQRRHQRDPGERSRQQCRLHHRAVRPMGRCRRRRADRKLAFRRRRLQRR